MSHLALKDTLRHLREAGGVVLDRLSDLTGYAAIRVPLRKAGRPGEVTLDLTGYRQINTYCCGAVASAMIVKYLRPQVSFERIHAAVNPLPETGAGNLRVTRALRSLGIKVSRSTRLTFAGLCAAIDAGHPVLLCVKTDDLSVDHWVVVYGYGRRPNLVFVAGNGPLLIARQRMSWRNFRQQWSPPGMGWVCSKAGRN